MSAFDVYCLMQADTLKFLLIAIALCNLFPGAILGVISFTPPCGDQESVAMRKVAKRCLLAAVVMGTLAAACPGTRTLAAMWVVPRLVNNEEIATDLRDVYELGLERLKESLRDTRDVPRKERI